MECGHTGDVAKFGEGSSTSVGTCAFTIDDPLKGLSHDSRNIKFVEAVECETCWVV